MTLMTQLIVALDLPTSPSFVRRNDCGTALEARDLFTQLYWNADVRWFKIGTPLTFGAVELCIDIAARANLFLDLKLYGTRDTIERVARQAFDLGARFLTVHATPSMLEAAMRAKPPGDYHKVLAVDRLTNGSPPGISPYGDVYKLADGRICSVDVAATLHSDGNSQIFVCPGIRLRGKRYTNPISADNHVNPATPAEAKAAGVDYIVVGRPIYEADDPVVSAWAIMEEIA
jgi:orotidine-5'-phosphate decarboxylase